MQLSAHCESKHSLPTYDDLVHCLPQRVFRSPQAPNINPYSTYKKALLCVLYILPDAQFISAGANIDLVRFLTVMDEPGGQKRRSSQKDFEQF